MYRQQLNATVTEINNFLRGGIDALLRQGLHVVDRGTLNQTILELDALIKEHVKKKERLENADSGNPQENSSRNGRIVNEKSPLIDSAAEALKKAEATASDELEKFLKNASGLLEGLRQLNSRLFAWQNKKTGQITWQPTHQAIPGATNSNSLNWKDGIPENLWRQVLKYLTLQDAKQLAETCKRFYDMVQEGYTFEESRNPIFVIKQPPDFPQGTRIFYKAFEEKSAERNPVPVVPLSFNDLQKKIKDSINQEAIKKILSDLPSQTYEDIALQIKEKRDNKRIPYMLCRITFVIIGVMGTIYFMLWENTAKNKSTRLIYILGAIASLTMMLSCLLAIPLHKCISRLYGDWRLPYEINKTIEEGLKPPPSVFFKPAASYREGIEENISPANEAGNENSSVIIVRPN